MTKTQAIKETSQETTSLYKFGDQWRYNYFDLSVNAWRESNPTNYWSACNSRKIHMIKTCRDKMGIVDNHWIEPGNYQGNGWKYWI